MRPVPAVVAWGEAGGCVGRLFESAGLVGAPEGTALGCLGGDAVVGATVEAPPAPDDGGGGGVETLDDTQQFEARAASGIFFRGLFAMQRESQIDDGGVDRLGFDRPDGFVDIGGPDGVDALRLEEPGELIGPAIAGRMLGEQDVEAMAGLNRDGAHGRVFRGWERGRCQEKGRTACRDGGWQGVRC